MEWKARGAFYESAGCLRDVIENHLFQIVALLAMEPPADRNYGAVQTEKAKIFRGHASASPDDFVRGQYAGYRKEPGVAKNPMLKPIARFDCLSIPGVGKACRGICDPANILRTTATEIVVELKASAAEAL